MNWKVFTIACVSTAMVSFPQNIIGCGGESDPYDYYISFFHSQLPDAKAYQPFYYTSWNFLYDDQEPVETSDLLAKEWAGFCGTPVTDADAKKFVNKFAWKDLNNLYYNVEKNQPLKIPDSVKKNSMTGYFMKTKNLEPLGYIMFAKQVEPYVLGTADYWEAPVRDTAKMNKLIKNGFQLFNAAKLDFIQLRYIYQVLRLAHYSGRYKDVIEWYDKYAIASQSNSVIKDLSLALKAGALFRTNQTKEAAYLFSKVFASTQAKRVSNYLGFTWSIKRNEDRNAYLKLCKNNTEKANMLAMFTLGSSTSSEFKSMKEVYEMDPGNEMLEVLAVREVNKLEENYLSPYLAKEKGNKDYGIMWMDNYQADSIMNEVSKILKPVSQFFNTVAQNNKTANKGLFETAAAYIAWMMKDYTTAKKYLSAAEKMNLTQKVKDQWALTNLLVTINEKTKIDAAFEEQLLPSVQWLRDKALNEKSLQFGYWEVEQWKTFYRNLFASILASKYHAQGDIHKEALCYGAADKIAAGFDFGNKSGVGFLQSKMESEDVEKLYGLVNQRQPNSFESFLIKNNTIKKSDVTDFAGTAYLRENNYAKAIEWFKKSDEKMVINKNPFIELLYDQVERLPSENKTSTTKLAFAEEMLKLQQTTERAKGPGVSAIYYKMALGMYNTTYYGHTWELVQYNRSGSDGYYIPDNATAFEKEYYGAFRALEYFKTAMDISTDKNFKAKCLFMMAKCNQKQLHRPQYNEYASEYDKMEAAEKKYIRDFMASKYFPQFVKDYGNTSFYKEAYNSCSYLRDFVKKK